MSSSYGINYIFPFDLTLLCSSSHPRNIFMPFWDAGWWVDEKINIFSPLVAHSTLPPPPPREKKRWQQHLGHAINKNTHDKPPSSGRPPLRQKRRKAARKVKENAINVFVGGVERVPRRIVLQINHRRATASEQMAFKKQLTAVM